MALKVMNFIDYGVYVLPDELEIQKAFRTAYFDGKLYLIRPKDVKVDYEPTEQEIKKYYEENKEKFKEKEKRVVYVWILEDKEVVQDYYKLLKERKIPEGYKELSEVSLPRRVKEVADKLNENNRLKLIKEKNTYYILFFKERQKPKLKPLDEVREEIKGILITREREKSLEKYSKEVKEKLIRGEKVDIKPLKFDKASLDEINKILRIEQKDILELIFGKEKVFGPFVALNGYGILVIDKRGFEEPDKNKIYEIEKEIKETKFQDIIGFYVDSLIKEYKVKVNEELLNRL
ncbi:MAG TPA: peptidyl-prolyl cis-trans isomerase [Aquificaceae bacterium]|nr:peptidyl-prolyl cis-trans isomerase [Aquificaceae bacterium]